MPLIRPHMHLLKAEERKKRNRNTLFHDLHVCVFASLLQSVCIYRKISRGMFSFCSASINIMQMLMLDRITARRVIDILSTGTRSEWGIKKISVFNAKISRRYQSNLLNHFLNTHFYRHTHTHTHTLIKSVI